MAVTATILGGTIFSNVAQVNGVKGTPGAAVAAVSEGLGKACIVESQRCHPQPLLGFHLPGGHPSQARFRFARFGFALFCRGFCRVSESEVHCEGQGCSGFSGGDAAGKLRPGTPREKQRSEAEV